MLYVENWKGVWRMYGSRVRGKRQGVCAYAREEKVRADGSLVGVIFEVRTVLVKTCFLERM